MKKAYENVPYAADQAAQEAEEEQQEIAPLEACPTGSVELPVGHDRE